MRLSPFDAPIDTASGVPYYRQIIERVMLGIADGTLSTGDKLPTVRSLAVDLQINPNTVGRAYHDLEIMGVVETRPGSGTFISSLRPRLPEYERQRRLERSCMQMAAKAQSLGFSIEELIETLKEIQRASERPDAHRDAGPEGGREDPLPAPKTSPPKSSPRRAS